MVGPVLVTVEAPRIAKFAADPKKLRLAARSKNGVGVADAMQAAGNPAGSKGAKSNGAEVMDPISRFIVLG